MARPPKETAKETTKETPKENIKVTIELLREGAVIPKYMTEGAGCADVYLPQTVAVPPVSLEPKATEVPLGFKVVVPKGHTLRLQLRSSVGNKLPLSLGNIEGIIDEDFRGEVKLFLRNYGKQLLVLEQGTRIAQCWLEKTQPIEFIEGNVEAVTKRGLESGSTGV